MYTSIFSQSTDTNQYMNLPFLYFSVLGQFGFFTRGLMIGIALLRILRPPIFWLPPLIEREPLLESRFSTDIPASAPTDNLLLPLRPIMSEIERKQNSNVLVPVLL